MKTWYFDDLARKFRLSQLVKIEDELIKLEKDTSIRKNILKIAETRGDAIEYWNSHTPEQRAIFGKSKDEIENGYNAKFRSIITFENVANLAFEDLPEFWQACWLSGTTDFFMLKNTPDVVGTQKKGESN